MCRAHGFSCQLPHFTQLFQKTKVSANIGADFGVGPEIGGDIAMFSSFLMLCSQKRKTRIREPRFGIVSCPWKRWKLVGLGDFFPFGPPGGAGGAPPGPHVVPTSSLLVKISAKNARFRLYRHRTLQSNTRCSAFLEIYWSSTRLSVWNFEIWQHLPMFAILIICARFLKFAQIISRKLLIFWTDFC